jgi:hypothetical protein
MFKRDLHRFDTRIPRDCCRSASPTAHKAGELHGVNKLGFLLLEGDTNGDGKADFQIKVVGDITVHDIIR